MPRPFRRVPVGNKKKFNKKGYKQKNAYKPKQKKKFMKKRQPFVETKKAKATVAVDEVMNPLQTPEQPTAWYRTWRQKQLSPISQFMFLYRGVGNDKMIGRDIFSKYLKQKIEITLPHGVIPDTTTPNGNQNRPFCRITQPIQIWVVWGWIKKPFGLRTSRSNPNNQITVDEVMEEVDRVTADGNELLGHLQGRGTMDSDFLTFKDKRKKMWTQQKRLLRPRDVPTSVKTPRGQIWQTTSPTGTGDTEGHVSNRSADFGDYEAFWGYPNVLQTTITWDTQRKMRFQGSDGDITGSPCFARDSWIPYSYICVPKQFQDATNRASHADYFYPTDGSTVTHRFKDLVGDMKVSCQTCHWFTDS